MAYVNLYSVKFDSLKSRDFKVEIINDYKKKETAIDGLRPKPVKLKDGGYVLYIWSHTGESAKLKAERILDERIHSK